MCANIVPAAYQQQPVVPVASSACAFLCLLLPVPVASAAAEAKVLQFQMVRLSTSLSLSEARLPIEPIDSTALLTEPVIQAKTAVAQCWQKIPRGSKELSSQLSQVVGKSLSSPQLRLVGHSTLWTASRPRCLLCCFVEIKRRKGR